jgi:hypothetical protein
MVGTEGQDSNRDLSIDLSSHNGYSKRQPISTSMKGDENMKKLLRAILAIMMVFVLVGCSLSSSKQGEVVSIAVSFSLNDMLAGNIDNPTYGNTVTVETKNGNQYTALWDEQLLGRPISMDLAGVVVEIKPTNDPDMWKVTKIISEP